GDGKLVVAGYTDNNVAGGANNMGVVRLKTDGTLDTGFNGTGKQQVDFGADDKANAVALQSDGRIVLAGTTTLGGNGANPNDFAVARLIGRDTDIIGRDLGGNWWVNHTTGSAFNVSQATTMWNEAAGWKDVQAGDFDGNGLSDILGRDRN